VSDPRLDADLRNRFQQLRSEDRAAAPDFAAMVERVREAPASGDPVPGVRRGTEPAGPGSWRGPRRLVAGGTLAAAAALAAFLLLNPQARADREFERTVRRFTTATAGWRSPTDVLLDFPGSELTRSVPRVGGPAWPDGSVGAPRRNRS
jgi:hypothetical protein